MKNKLTTLLLLFPVVGCLSLKPKADVRRPVALAEMQPRSDSTVAGTVRFVQKGAGMTEIQYDLSGGKPNGSHGFHVHEVGDCSAPDASSAGPHFNPHAAMHGGRMDGNRHAGDFGNLKSDAKGRMKGTFIMKDISLGADPASFIGKAVVVHADNDDLKTQPTGNSGARVACGVITLATAE